MSQDRPTLKSPREIGIMREAGRIVAETLALLTEQAKPGMTTAQLDRIAYEHIRERGAVPSFKGYNGFPASLCISVNEQIVHGIPGERVLEEGDLLSMDCGAFYRGFHGDAATTVGVGEIDPALQKMIDDGWEALAAGIERARAGNQLDEIGTTIKADLERKGYGVVGDGLAGHGVGRYLHEAPAVPNHSIPGHGPRLVPGMTLAIEPMYTRSDPHWLTLDNGWTIVTADGGLSAHVEHTVAVTEGEPEILTAL